MLSDIPAATACDCAAASCTSSCHCNQRVEIHGLRLVGDELGDSVGAGMLQRFGPLMPVTAVFLGQCTPGGEIVEGSTLTGAESGIRQFATRRTWDPQRIDQFQGRPLGLPCAVAVDRVERVCVPLHVVA